MHKRSNWNRYLMAGLMGLCMVLLPACQQETKQEPIEITLMHGFGGTLESYKKMQERSVA